MSARGDNNIGAAYIYKKEDGSWNEKQILTASNGSNYDYFGRDYDG